MSTLIRQIKKHRIVTTIGALFVVMAGVVTTFDFRDKVCSSFPSHFKPARLEERIHHIWTDVPQDEIKQVFGAPILKKELNSKEFWIYKTTNSFFALGFTEDGFVNQFIIAVPENTLNKFSGYQLHHPDIYGNFTLGKSTLESFGIIEAGVGAQRGYVYASIDPPYLLRKSGYWHNIQLKAFDTHIFKRTMFGYAVLDSTLSSRLNHCEPPECTENDKEKARIEISTTIPGWLHVSNSGASEVDDKWLVEQFSLVDEKKVEYGGLLSECCANIESGN